jgi:hypothetical protein
VRLVALDGERSPRLAGAKIGTQAPDSLRSFDDPGEALSMAPSTASSCRDDTMSGFPDARTFEESPLPKGKRFGAEPAPPRSL